MESQQFIKTLSSAFMTDFTTTHAPANKWELTDLANYTGGTESEYKAKDMTLSIEDPENLGRGVTPRMHKMLDYSLFELSKVNHFGSDKNLTTSIMFKTESYIEALGRTNNTSSRVNFNREINEDLKALAHISITYKDVLTDINLVDCFFIKRGYVHITFSQAFVEHINTNQMIFYPLNLLKVPIKSPLTYLIGKKLATLYSMTGNQKRNRHNIIKFDTLVQTLEGPIPSYDTVLEEHAGRAKQWIVNPMEKALSSLQDSNILTYRYTGPKHEPLSEDMLDETYYKIIALKMISFELTNADFVDSESQGTM